MGYKYLNYDRKKFPSPITARLQVILTGVMA